MRATRITFLALLGCLGFSTFARAEAPGENAASVPVAVVINPYAGDRAGPLHGDDAAAMTQGGLETVIAAAGGTIARQQTVALTDEDMQQYGQWNRFGLASGHLADMTAANRADGLINMGFYNNCESLMGMLGGLRHSASPPARLAAVMSARWPLARPKWFHWPYCFRSSSVRATVWCRAMRPPAASITASPGSGSRSPTAAMRSTSMRTSAIMPGSPVPSITWAPVSSVVGGGIPAMPSSRGDGWRQPQFASVRRAKPPTSRVQLSGRRRGWVRLHLVFDIGSPSHLRLPVCGS